MQKANPSSPLIGLSDKFVAFGTQYNVNPALIVGMAQKETSLGTAGYGTAPKYNIGNIRGGNDGTGFESYSGYQEGLEAMYKNLRTGLYLDPPASLTTVEQVINTWAPPTENETSAYVLFVLEVMRKILAGLSANGGGDTISGCGSEDGLVIDGYAFPVAPQKKSENSEVKGMSPLPCSDPGNCHHWEKYPSGGYAFDISRQPGGDAIVGTPVYAISDGELDLVHPYKFNGVPISGCFSLQLHSSQDNFWYYYAHIQNVRVKTGDPVRAGQQLAEIGPRKCTGNNSDSHLHIDRGCLENGIPQKGGREECRDPGIVPLINNLFERLQ